MQKVIVWKLYIYEIKNVKPNKNEILPKYYHKVKKQKNWQALQNTSVFWIWSSNVIFYLMCFKNLVV